MRQGHGQSATGMSTRNQDPGTRVSSWHSDTAQRGVSRAASHFPGESSHPRQPARHDKSHANSTLDDHGRKNGIRPQQQGPPNQPNDQQKPSKAKPINTRLQDMAGHHHSHSNGDPKGHEDQSLLRSGLQHGIPQQQQHSAWRGNAGFRGHNGATQQPSLQHNPHVGRGGFLSSQPRQQQRYPIPVKNHFEGLPN